MNPGLVAIVNSLEYIIPLFRWFSLQPKRDALVFSAPLGAFEVCNIARTS
jgi:hypothetical protein